MRPPSKLVYYCQRSRAVRLHGRGVVLASGSLSDRPSEGHEASRRSLTGGSRHAVWCSTVHGQPSRDDEQVENESSLGITYSRLQVSHPTPPVSLGPIHLPHTAIRTNHRSNSETRGIRENSIPSTVILYMTAAIDLNGIAIPHHNLWAGASATLSLQHAHSGLVLTVVRILRFSEPCSHR